MAAFLSELNVLYLLLFWRKIQLRMLLLWLTVQRSINARSAPPITTSRSCL